MYTVVLLSEDGQKFNFRTKVKSREKAIELAFDKLKELQYDNYGYSLYSVNEDSH